MVALDGRTSMEILSSAQCWELLGAHTVGRLGVLVDSAPEIFPLNYGVVDRSIVFRTDPGTKLRGLSRSPAVSFEIDGFDTEDRRGWSVLVKGTAAHLERSQDLDRVRDVALPLWTVGEKGAWVRIAPREVTGRRIGATASKELS